MVHKSAWFQEEHFLKMPFVIAVIIFDSYSPETAIMVASFQRVKSGFVLI